MIAAYQPRRRSRMHRPVLVGEPEQLLECARRTRNGGCRCLVERHARFPLVVVGRRMAPVPRRPSFTGARVEIISERCLWVTSATFGLGGRVSLTATELSSEYLRRCTLAWVMAKNFARGTSIRAGFCRSRCTSSCPQVIWISEPTATMRSRNATPPAGPRKSKLFTSPRARK